MGCKFWKKVGMQVGENGSVIAGANGSATPEERISQIKAERAELQLQKDLGNICDVETVRVMLDRWAIVLREAGTQLAREFGNDAHQILDDALVTFENIVEDFISGLEEEKTNGRTE